MAKPITRWFKQAWQTFVDPERDKRVDKLKLLLGRELARRKREFALDVAVRDLGANEADPKDIEDACEAVYDEYLRKAWSDFELTEKEELTLKWMSSALRISSKHRDRVHDELGADVFLQMVSAAIADGHIDEIEALRLKHVADWLQTDVRSMVKRLFARKGDSFLTSIFQDGVNEGRPLGPKWEEFLTNAERLGFKRHEAVEMIKPHAKRFIEHSLVDAKDCEMIDSRTASEIRQWVRVFGLDQNYQTYVNESLKDLELLWKISQGELPTYNVKSLVELRSGELAHFYGPAVFEQIKNLKSGPRIDRHHGTVVISDHRLIFISETRPISLNLRQILKVDRDDRAIELVASQSATGSFRFGDQTRLASAILSVAVGRANQTIVNRAKRAPDRHISREVRQRVWQRYGGRCADCSATEYLEFDHIVPFSKGGSNSDNNVQLLCRKCNLKKSDNI